jgi:hypothetical protein
VSTIDDAVNRDADPWQTKAGGQRVGNDLPVELVHVSTDGDDRPTAHMQWITASQAQMAWEHAMPIMFKPPINRSGKTRVQKVSRELAHDALASTNISIAALVRSIDEADPRTLIIDEVDQPPELPEPARRHRAERARAAYSLRLALASARGRTANNAANAGPDNRRSPKTGEATSDVLSV